MSGARSTAGIESAGAADAGSEVKAMLEGTPSPRVFLQECDFIDVTFPYFCKSMIQHELGTVRKSPRVAGESAGTQGENRPLPGGSPARMGDKAKNP